MASKQSKKSESTPKSTARYGLFYKSNGKWVGPYQGRSYTENMISRNPVKSELAHYKNNVLKAKTQIRPVK